MTTQTIRAAFIGTRVHHATVAKAERLEIALQAEYKGIELDVQCAEGSKDYTLFATCDGIEIDWAGEVPSLSDVLEAFQEHEVTEEQMLGGEPDDEDEEPEGSRSVVREGYRQEYRVVSSNKQTNGDWLAETLTTLFWDSKEGFNTAGFEALLDQNGVDMSAPWAQVLGTKGGAGRFRMNGRQALEKRIALADRFVMTGAEGESMVVTAATDADFGAWQVDNRIRHAGYLGKVAKAEAKAAAKAAAAE